MAAVDCDDDSNKSLCGQMGVQGFPTLKIVVPSKKPGKPIVEDYKGPRTTKGIVDAVVEKIPNHVKRVTDKDVTNWLETDNSTTKAVLFTEKGTTSALLRALAIDYLGTIKVGQIRNKESSAVEMFGITKFPTLVLLPGGEQESQVYDGELNKKDISKFLSQVAESKPDSAQSKKKKSTSSTESASSASSAEESTETPADSIPNEQSSEDASAEEPIKPAEPTFQPEPDIPPLRVIGSEPELRKFCLGPKTGTCILALLDLPERADIQPPVPVIEGMLTLAEIEYKHVLRQAKLFPFYMVPASIVRRAKLIDALDLKLEGQIDVIAINSRRGWWRRYDPGEQLSFNKAQLETWIDEIRLGEGKKHKVPEEIMTELHEPETESPEDTPPTEESSEDTEQPTDEGQKEDQKEEQPKEDQETETPKHEEL